MDEGRIAREESARLDELTKRMSNRSWTRRLKELRVAGQTTGEAFSRKEQNRQARADIEALIEHQELPEGWRLDVSEERRPRPDGLASTLVRTLTLEGPDGQVRELLLSPRLTDLIAVALAVQDAFAWIFAAVAPQPSTVERSASDAADATPEG